MYRIDVKKVPREAVSKPFSPNYFHTPTGSVLQTESTTNMDSDEALSSSSSFFYSPDRIATATSASRKNSSLSQAMNQYQSPNSTFSNYSSNPQLLWTQPVRTIESHAPAHTHTKSYDVTNICPPYAMPLYMCGSPYDARMQGYYPQPYVEDYQWDESGNYIDPAYYATQPSMCPQIYGNDPMSKKGVRKKNPETEADRAKYLINLEDILNKKDMRTTIMIKNIPNKYNQKMLLKKIDEVSKRQYDFFYLPIDFKVSLTGLSNM